MRRILFVQGGLERAGAEQVLLNLLRSLDRSEFEPIVAFAGHGPFVDEVAAHGVRTVELPVPGRLREVHRVPGMVRAVARAVEESGAEIVHANGEKMSFYAGWGARQAGRPCIFWLHDAPGGAGGARLAQAAMRFTPRSAVVTCARWMTGEFRRSFGIRAEGIQNGVVLEDLVAGSDAMRSLAGEVGWPADAVVAAHFARLQRWKGTDVFLRGAARAAAAAPNLRFLVVGGALYGRETEYAASLPALARELGLGDRVHLAGHRLDALRLMAGAGIVVHCSVAPEPFPMVVLEAMALGRPLIATRTRGPEEAVDHGRTGVLVAPGDDEALAGHMVRLAGDARGRALLGAEALRSAREQFSARRMAAEFEDLYRRLAS